MSLIDVTDMAGRSFTAKSGNVAVIDLFDDDGIAMKWQREPEQADIDEFRGWLVLQLRISYETAILGDCADSHDLRAFLERSRPVKGPKHNGSGRR